MVRLVNGAGTVVEVSEELASRLPGFRPVPEKVKKPAPAPKESTPKRKPKK